MYGRTGDSCPNSKSIIVFKDGELYGEYPSIFEFAKTKGAKFTNDPTSKAAQRLLNGWKPVMKNHKLYGFTASYKQLSEY